MNLFWISITALGGLFYLSVKGRRSLISKAKVSAAGTKPVGKTEDKVPAPESGSKAKKGSAAADAKAADSQTATSQDAQSADKTPQAQPAAVETVSLQEKVEAAVSSGEVDKMTAILEKTDDPLLRDTLYGHIAGIYYRQRSDSDSRRDFYEYAGRHIEEINTIIEAMEKEGKERPDRVETFKMIAITMEEDECYNEAIEVSKKALSLGFKDGTRTGFEGRISRLEKKRDTPG